MDALEFVKQLRRMDEKGVLKNHFIYPRVGRETDSLEDVVAEVEEWAKVNPIKTRQSVFLAQFPGAKTIEGVLTICPYNLGLIDKCKSKLGILCYDCRHEFWMQEVE